ncbi:amidohydrolase family protein [Desertimonas flava]|uniref:amidohydrolase family protein n=1 Tax=Desertimonas flava TaxID=2064846 RepID=UPI000E34AECA|nr:amidohydrolase family protein [Desertimonas flava]
MTSLLITNAAVFDAAIGREGRDVTPTDVAVVDGEIVAVGPDARTAAEFDEVVDAGGRVVIPGLINAHLHSNQTLEAGLCDELPLDAYLVLASYGGAGARFSPHELGLSAKVGALDMLLGGTTSVVDCARSDDEWFADGMDAVCQAYADLGIRAGVAAQYSDLDYMSSIPGWLIDGSHTAGVPRLSVDEVMGPVGAFVTRWSSRTPLVRPMLGPSSLPRCSVELFESSVELSRGSGVPLQTHLLSASGQVEVARQRYAGSTVGFLEKVGALEATSSFAHAIWLDPREIGIMAEHAAVAVHNPASNLKLSAGLAPIPDLLAAGAPVALGSDGASSNDSLNMFETLKLSALVQRVRGPLAPSPKALDALEMLWDGGRAVLGQPVGRIAPGYRADLVILDRLRFSPGPAAQIANQLVFAELGQSVEDVYVDGRRLVAGRQLVGVDEAAIRDEAREVRERLWAGLPERLQRFEERRPFLESLEASLAGIELDFARYWS